MTTWHAAGHPPAPKVILTDAQLVLPFIIACTVFSYRVFRSKARESTYD